MRLVALSGLLICSMAATLGAADNDADRFVETAKKLIQAINSDDAAPSRQASTLRCSEPCRPTRLCLFSADLCPPKAS